MDQPKIAYFGTPPRARDTLSALVEAGFRPDLVITTPDRPQGRGMKVLPTPVKEYALNEGIPVQAPEKVDELRETLQSGAWDLFIVVAYGKILPEWLIDIPKKGCLNIHYSLLPLYRGASPVEGQILNGEEVVGVTIMQIDELLDHGPIIAQDALPMPDPLPTSGELAEILTDVGSRLLIDTLPEWLEGNIDPQEQEHDQATFTKKFSKEDARVDFNANPLSNFRKIQAFTPSPGPYFFSSDKSGKEMRVKITKASFKDGELKLERVVPEGKSEMSFEEFRKRYCEMSL
jgi:methionyl-tRNA formyltransferase